MTEAPQCPAQCVGVPRTTVMLTVVVFLVVLCAAYGCGYVHGRWSLQNAFKQQLEFETQQEKKSSNI
jgi:hypothetical protein